MPKGMGPRAELATMAVEVFRYLPPGANPELDPAQSFVQIYATNGNVVWQEGDLVRSIENGKNHLIVAYFYKFPRSACSRSIDSNKA